ncbi:hypothetical protein V3W47_11500 [Deinococcus sp. YIM 134068]|uniref:hypothetical protein n=1 Tax=Deinococcus lichenicola TaxID=3118910 RepID=UPI002F9263C8
MSEVNISTVNGTPDEERVRSALLDLMRQHDLSRWTWATDVRIDRDLPALGQCSREDGRHVVRLRSAKQPANVEGSAPPRINWHGLLTVYVHEQLHAYLDLKDDQVQQAVEELRHLYPSVPGGGEEGARSEFSTYLHLILCTLELEGVSSLIGEATYREIKAEPRFYRFIYRTVLRDTDALRDLIRRHGLNLSA